jgi:hypothetical protein
MWVVQYLCMYQQRSTLSVSQTYFYGVGTYFPYFSTSSSSDICTTDILDSKVGRLKSKENWNAQGKRKKTSPMKNFSQFSVLFSSDKSDSLFSVCLLLLSHSVARSCLLFSASIFCSFFPQIQCFSPPR